jgi:ribulose-phosphate 3-epimerase
MECHLMVKNPERYIDQVIEYGAKYVSIHYEATTHVQKALQHIKEKGAKTAIALNPATPLSVLDYIIEDLDMITIMTVNPGFAGQKLVPATLKKISEAREMVEKSNLSNVCIQVDGNVSFENIPKMINSGANMLVGGTSSIFNKNFSIEEGVRKIRNLISKN